MMEADGIHFQGGKLVDFCTPDSPQAVRIQNTSCYRNLTAFPTQVWQMGGWACRFNPCVAAADPADHSPYMHGSITDPALSKEWSQASIDAAAVHALQDGSWGNWGFNVKNKTGQILGFRNGGFQEQTGAGFDGSGSGKHRANGYFVEMVLEELDQEGEFFYDEVARRLYVKLNQTANPGESWKGMVAPAVSERVLSIVGTQADPVKHLSFKGITFENTRVTFLGGATTPRYQASGSGDWSLYPSAGVYLEGAEEIAFEGCSFLEMGGNALMLMGYNRFINITGNDFNGAGDSAILFVGKPKGGIQSPDGTDGNFPSDNSIFRNHIRQTGVLTKQSSGFSSIASCHNRLVDNVIYNGARAGINFNDNIGGGDVVRGNLVFNQVRESNDHGPVNSWDRSPFVTLRGETPGKATTTPAYRYITHNLLVNAGEWTLDHDDGSRYMVDDSNVLVYGGAKQCYHGYNMNVSRNLFVRPDDACGHDYCMENDASGVSAPKPQLNFFVNNTCIIAGNRSVMDGGTYLDMRKAPPFDPVQCHLDLASSDVTQTIATTFLTDSGDLNAWSNSTNTTYQLPCHARSYREWQSLGFDQGGVVAKMPEARVIMTMARELLELE